MDKKAPEDKHEKFSYEDCPDCYAAAKFYPRMDHGTFESGTLICSLCGLEDYNWEVNIG